MTFKGHFLDVKDFVHQTKATKDIDCTASVIHIYTTAA